MKPPPATARTGGDNEGELPAYGRGGGTISDRPRAHEKLRDAPWAAWSLFLGLLVAAELHLTFGSPGVGALLHAVLLIAIALYAGTGADPRRKMSAPLIFAPLIRIIGLALPLADVPLIYWSAFISIPLFMAVIPTMNVTGISRRGLGLQAGNLVYQGGIAILGLPLGIVCYDLLRPTALISVFDWRLIAQSSFILFVSTGLLEEIIFRGLLRVAACDVFGQWGIFYSSAAFATLQIENRSLANIAFAFCVGVLFSWLAERSNSVIGVVVAHALISIGVFLIYPFVRVPLT